MGRATMGLFVALAAGPACTGYIGFAAVDPSFEVRPRSPVHMLVASMDCTDYESPRRGFLFLDPDIVSLYVATCGKNGGGIPWKVLGAFHVGSIAFTRWDQYSRDVAEKAWLRGCPGVLIRGAPPFSSRNAEAIGALCVDPGQPSGVQGPMRIAAYNDDTTRVLGNDEPDPPDENPRPAPSGWGR